MKRLILSSVILSTLTFGFAANAAPSDDTPDFSYVEAGIGNINFDSDLAPLSGADVLGVKGSWEFSDMGYVRMSYADADYDGMDADANQFTAGVGAQYPLSMRTALFGDINYFHVEYNTPFGDTDEDGYQVNTGVKSRIMPELELTGTISYTDTGDEDGMEVTVGGRYFFTDQFAVGLDVSRTPDSDLFLFVGRYSF
jgi:hypothetical protein